MPQNYSTIATLTNLFGTATQQSSFQADTELRSDKPNDNYGTINNFSVIYSAGAIRRSLIRVSMPEGVGVIKRVRIFLYKYSDKAGVPCLPVEVHQLTRTSWVETQATWNVARTGEPWTTPGGDFSPTIVDVTNNPFPQGSYGWEHWDLGPGAMNPIEGLTWGTQLNLLLKADETSNTETHWRTREHGTQPPYLLVEYEIPLIPPITAADPATDVTTDSAVLHGRILDFGASVPTERGFVYSTSYHPNPGNVPPNQSGYENYVYEQGSFPLGEYSLPVTSLQPGVKYHVRAYAKNAIGYGYSGDEITFNTIGLLNAAELTELVWEKLSTVALGTKIEGLKKDTVAAASMLEAEEVSTIANFTYLIDYLDLPIQQEPPDGSSESIPVYFVWTIPHDPKGKNLASHIQIDKSSNLFNDIEFESSSDRSNEFEIFDGTNWINYPVTGAPPSLYGNKARIKVNNLTLGVKYWRVRVGRVKN
ncbi:MAG: DNRLRE domain-containing protein [Halobacteria archaeon]